MGKASPLKMPTVVSRPEIFSSNKTSESYRNASASAAFQSSTRSTNCKPTLEPCRTGLSTTGGCPPAGHRVFGGGNTSQRPRGTPRAADPFFVGTLLNATALPSGTHPGLSTPHPSQSLFNPPLPP